MQSKLQQFQNTFLKKQSNKLSLQIKLSVINSNYYEQTLARSLKYSQSPTTKNSISVRSFETPRSDFMMANCTEEIDDRVEKLQHEVEKQIVMIQKFKDLLRQRLEEYQNIQLCRQKHMKELTLKRKIQIETLKRQVNLAIKRNIEQRGQFFHQLDSQFDITVDQFFKQWKKMKKNWKSQLKLILQRFQRYSNPKNQQIDSSPQAQSSQNQYNISLKSLQNELKTHIISSQKESIKLQLQLSTLVQNFEIQRQKIREKFKNNFLQILDSVQNLQKNIKSEVKKEHFEAEKNREKLLLLFEENVEKIQNERITQQRQKLNKYKNKNLQYRHLVQIHSTLKTSIG